MPRNTLNDLNNHLFEQIERLNDDDLSPEELDKEIKRAKAIKGIASNIISNAALALEAEKFTTEYARRDIRLPEVLGNKKSD